ncbi:MAG TPA: glycerol-3-phosphate responsive antiterminator [Lachnospiraceae bacterium]|nr:glycerol-3-phosphate responsive antiterminator [Lachnospiraceae bacterium]
MNQIFYDAVQENPIIAAIKDDEGLEECLKSNIQVIFILYGDICSIPEIVGRIKDSGRIAMVHIDLINGLSGKDISVDFIHKNTRADGIITTRQGLVLRAKELGLYTILRIFVIDSMALSEAGRIKIVQPDFIEILPGIMPKIIKKIRMSTKIPLLAGGLISEKQDVIDALDAGAMAVSSTSKKVWSF